MACIIIQENIDQWIIDFYCGQTQYTIVSTGQTIGGGCSGITSPFIPCTNDCVIFDFNPNQELIPIQYHGAECSPALFELNYELSEVDLVSSSGGIDVSAFPTICAGTYDPNIGGGAISVRFKISIVDNCPECCNNSCQSFIGYTNSASIPIEFTNAIPPCPSGAGPASVYSKLSRFTDWNFTLPANANILGVQATINRTSSNNAQSSDSIIKLMADHKILGQNKANFDEDYFSVDHDYIYGGYDDTWGVNLTPEDINGEGFGIAMESEGASFGMSSDVYLNHIEISVNYEFEGAVEVATKQLDWDGAVYPIF